MAKFDNRITITLDDESLAHIDDMTASGNCTRAQAVRNIIAEWRYLTNLQAALGKRPEREQDHSDPGGHG